MASTSAPGASPHPPVRALRLRFLAILVTACLLATAASAADTTDASEYCRRYARSHSGESSGGNAAGDTVRGAVGGAILGGIIGGGTGAGTGAAIGGGVGLLGGGSRNRRNYQSIYDTCMRTTSK